jgi:hypothetical protein
MARLREPDPNTSGAVVIKIVFTKEIALTTLNKTTVKYILVLPFLDTVQYRAGGTVFGNTFLSLVYLGKISSVGAIFPVMTRFLAVDAVGFAKPSEMAVSMAEVAVSLRICS